MLKADKIKHKPEDENALFGTLKHKENITGERSTFADLQNIGLKPSFKKIFSDNVSGEIRVRCSKPNTITENACVIAKASDGISSTGAVIHDRVRPTSVLFRKAKNIAAKTEKEELLTGENEALKKGILASKRASSAFEDGSGEQPKLKRECTNLARNVTFKLKQELGDEALNKSNLIKQTSSTAIKFEGQQTLQRDSYSSKLPNMVTDIDKNDEDSLLVSGYTNDIYEHLYNLESKQPIHKNHLKRQLVIKPNMRAILIDWIYEVHINFKLVTETFQLAVSIIDQYLQIVYDLVRSKLQLVGATALFIACKYEEVHPPALYDFVYITKDTYTAYQIRQMELKILKTINYNLSRPLPIHFLQRFSKAGDADSTHRAMSKYFVELSMIEADMAHHKPSEIAAAAVYLSSKILKRENYVLATDSTDSCWTSTLQWYTKYQIEHIKPIARKIAIIARNAPIAELKAVYNNYKSPGNFNVSTLTQKHEALIDSIIEMENNVEFSLCVLCKGRLFNVLAVKQAKMNAIILGGSRFKKLNYGASEI
uniref:Cyclin N-terminal domain-containing protein n=1 Tax=Glossina austeni TaxID=7395 RepID=A0A1A9UVW7_GLOAU